MDKLILVLLTSYRYLENMPLKPCSPVYLKYLYRNNLTKAQLTKTEQNRMTQLCKLDQNERKWTKIDHQSGSTEAKSMGRMCQNRPK